MADGRGGVCRCGRSSATDEAVPVGGFDDETGRGHGREAFVERGGADAAGGAQFGEWSGLVAVCEGCGDALVNGSGCRVGLWCAIGLDRLKGQNVASLGKLERKVGDGGGGAMLDAQDDAIVTITAEIEVGIAPGVEFRGSAQGLTGADGTGSLFGMVDDRDGDGMAPLQFAQEGEQRGDIATDILIDAMQTHERIEDQEPRLQPGDGGVETGAIRLEVEAQAGGGDHLHVEVGETDAGRGADAFEAATDDVQRVFGWVKQNAAGAAHREAPQAGDAGGDGHGQIEGEEGFAAFGLAADDADGFFRPQPIDEPALLFGAIGEAPGRLDRQLAHRRRRIAAFASPAVGTA
jgi:hypothetical protein